jgi:hypothetical protein
MNVKDWFEASELLEEEIGATEMSGWVETWLTRAMLPEEGERSGKVTFKEKVGVKVEGRTFEGRREADLRESRRDIFFSEQAGLVWFGLVDGVGCIGG